MSGFFGGAPGPPAVLKLGTFKRQLAKFAAMTGSTAAGRRVVYFDGFAGEGRYESGQPGSPLIAARIAEDLSSRDRRLECCFVEVDQRAYEKLETELGRIAGGQASFAWHLERGRAEDNVDRVLILADGVPLFAFLDPYGVSMPFRETVKLLSRSINRFGQPQTEILINLSAEAVRRIGGVLEADAYPAKDATIESLDRMLGGNWWHGFSLTGGVSTVADGYAERLAQAAANQGWQQVVVPVRRTEAQLPVYYLIFLTRADVGVWEFLKHVSLAHEEWRRAVRPYDEIHGQMALVTPDEAFAMVERAYQEQLIARVTENLRRIHGLRGQVVLPADLREVFDGVLGIAQQTHLRRAAQALEKAGVFRSPPPTGELGAAEFR